MNPDQVSTDALLKDEIALIPRIIGNLLDIRREAADKSSQTQAKQKSAFDCRQKKTYPYKKGDLVEPNPVATGNSRKLQNSC